MVTSRKKTLRAHPTRRKRTPVRKTASVLDLVRAGVERFVLKDATIISFRRSIRAASEKGGMWAHPLTGSSFRRIVKEAVQERKRRIRRALREQVEPGEGDFE